VARCHVTPSGLFDVADHSMSMKEQFAYDHVDDWGHPKRCGLWRVHPSSQVVTWAADVPGRGDTCFATVLPVTDRLWHVWNYSSPLDGTDDPTWFQGHTGPTQIYRATIDFGS
jgi:hypothetical protein